MKTDSCLKPDKEKHNFCGVTETALCAEAHMNAQHVDCETPDTLKQISACRGHMLSVSRLSDISLPWR